MIQLKSQRENGYLLQLLKWHFTNSLKLSFFFGDSDAIYLELKLGEIMSNPKGELAIRVQAMPVNTNPAGDIFGGWVLSQMDIAGGLYTKKISKGRTVTIAVDAMTFYKPVLVGDTLCCYVELIKTGKTSLSVKIETWVSRQYEEVREMVTEGTFTYVAVCSDRKPRLVTDVYR